MFVFSFSFFISVAKAQWVQASGTDGGSIKCFVMNNGNLFAATYNEGVLLSTNYGISWSAVNNGLPNQPSDAIAALKAFGGKIFASVFDGIYTSTNNGTSWTSNYGGLPGLTATTFASNGINLFAGLYNPITGTYYGVYRSKDSGASWIPINNGLTEPIVNTFTVDGINLFAGTYAGIFLSTDNGANWMTADSGLSVACIYALVANNGNMFAGTNGGVYFSSDNGTHWVTVNNGLIALDVRAFAVINNNIFVGTQSNGVYLSTNNGGSWNVENKGLTTLDVSSFIAYDGELFAGTIGGGIFRRPLSDFGITTVNEKPAAAPAQFTLAQNYPNPFSATTSIEFQIPNEEHVTLKVYNALGEEVATLVNGNVTAGEHNFSFNANGIQNGVYFYRLTAGKFSQSGEMAIDR